MMNGKRIVRTSLLAACALFALIALSSLASAQCAMCRTGLGGSPEAMKVAERFNFAVFVLLIPPVLLFCGFFLTVLRFRKGQGETVPGVREEIKSLIRLLLSKLSIHR
jgi:hypothetical protein